MNNNIILEFTKLINFIEIENSLISDKKQKNINLFRITSLKKNLYTISKLKYEIKSIEQIKNIKGFGSGTINRISEILKNGYLDEVKDLNKKYGKLKEKQNLINELMQVIGIGEIMAKEIINKNKIKSLKDLIKQVNEDKIQVNDKIKLGLKYVGKYETKIPRKIITEIYNIILKNNKNKDILLLLCGSYRRGLPQSSDIDLLICDLNLLFKEDLEESNILKTIINNLKKINLITDDITSSDVLTKYMGFCNYKDKNYRIDIRLIPYESIFSALLYFTGSYQLNTLMRINAKKLDYKLNEYGLYKNNIKIDINDEKDIFDLLKMEYLEPEQRNIF